MIRVISSAVFARSGDVALIKAKLLPNVDEIGNFSIETANSGGYWGTAVQQLPRDSVMPKLMQTPSFAAIVHTKDQTKTLEYPCLYPTWVRVVQYLNADQIPSVKARIEIKNMTFKKRLMRYFSSENIDPPIERIY